jgi:hypothetical protein
MVVMMDGDRGFSLLIELIIVYMLSLLAANANLSPVCFVCRMVRGWRLVEYASNFIVGSERH